MNLESKLRLWIPPLVWIIIIWSASTDPFSSEHTGRVLRSLPWLRLLSPLEFDRIHVTIRKTAHIAEYAVLCLLFFRSCCSMSNQQSKIFWQSRWALYSLLASATMGFLDEFHQRFVPSRTPTLRDVALDSTGALLAIVLIRIWVATRLRESAKAS